VSSDSIFMENYLYLLSQNKLLEIILSKNSSVLVTILLVSMLLSLIAPVTTLARSTDDTLSTDMPSPANVNSIQDFIPTMNIPPNVDINHNGVADNLDQEIATTRTNSLSQEYVDVIVMLKTQPTTDDTNAFISNGGTLTTNPWTYALYGFGGRIPYNKVSAFVEQCPDVLLIEEQAIASGNLAYATKQVGARTYVWNTLGLQGDPNSSIAVLDTGIDGSHTDFAPGYGDQNSAKKIVGWNDQVTFTASPVDDNGHGSHTSGLAAGDGFFSVDSTGRATATWSGNFAGASSGTYPVTGMMVNKTGNITLSVKWTSSGTARLNAIPLYYGDKTLDTSLWNQVAQVSTNNPNTVYTLTYPVVSTPTGGYDMYHPLVNVTSGTGTLYIAFNMSWPYTPPSDGFSAWTGMAPQSKLVGVKVLNNAGSGTSAQFISGINWVIANRMSYHITVASMSLGFGSEQSSVDSAVVNLVNSGVATIVSAGNSGAGGNIIYTPGSVDEVTTVAAMNQFDSIASYSSQGGTSHSTGNTVKPDITAPGGSFYGVPLFSADSNTNDAEGGFTEIQVNDAAPMQGTSMAAPIVAGAEQIIVQAMGGYNAWTYTRNQALMPKTILLMTATETYPNLREPSSSYSPTLDRGGKDVHEGYGRLNLDAGADAVLKTYQIGNTVSDSLGKPPTQSDISVLGQRLAWARNVQLVAGVQYNFSLSVPSGADYDLYLYNTTGNGYGEPVIVVKSTTATTGGFENIVYTPSLSGQYYIVVKLARENSGVGQFTLSSIASTDYWPMFRHDFQHSGYSASIAPNTNSTIWSYTTGSIVDSSPAVVDGRVYVGSNDGKIYCLNSSTGSFLWSYTTGAIGYSSPAVINGKVFIGTINGTVYCLNATEGTKIWEYTTSGQVWSSPIVTNGKVYIGSGNSNVYCLNAVTGAWIWNYTTGGIVYSSPAVVDGRLYVGSYDKNVYCLNAVTGAWIWNYTTGGIVYSSPCVVNNKVYVGSLDKRLYCLDATTGAYVWDYLTNGTIGSSPAVSGGRVYFGSDEGKINCLNATNGVLVWSHSIEGVFNIASSPAIADGKVYLGSLSNRTYCLDAITGSLLWSYTTGNGIWSSPAVVDGKVYVGSKDGKVYCFGVPTGFGVKDLTAWYWTGNTVINSVVSGDVDGDGFKEIVTGGYYFDGVRTIAQLVEWNGATLAVDRLTAWYWIGNTTINSIAIGDVDGDNQTEIVTGGFYNDGVRNIAQLIEWNGATLTVDRLTGWYWTGNTVINSVAIANVDGDAQVEIVTGGYYNDGVRNIAQLIEWNGANLAVDRLTGWYWTSNTVINSVALGDVDNDTQIEVVTGGYYNDGVRNIAQLIEWNGASLAVDRLTGWYWTSNTVVNSVAVGDADNDGSSEVVTGGYYNDGVRNIAQLIEWNGASLAVDRLTGWYWTSNTVINSVAIGDVDGDGQTEVVSGGYYNDGVRNIAQLIEWTGSNLAVDRLTGWYWTSNTVINSVAIGNVDGDGQTEVVTGGYYNDGARNIAQLTVWGMI
jgi:outer membrane protein assembly factor BamB